MTGVNEDDLASEFEVFDIDLTSADIDVMDKMKELCMVFRLDCADLASEWVAFSHTNDSLKLTVETLERLERDRLSKRKSAPKTPGSSKPQTGHYGSTTTNRSVSDADDDLLSSYGTPARKGTNKRQHTTPENISNKRGPVPRSVSAAFSPTSLGSPVPSTPSQKYMSRSNAKEIVCRYGAVGNVVWTGGENAASCQIDMLNPQSALKNNYKYMFQKLTDKALVLNDMIEDMTEVLQEKYELENISHVALPIQESVTVAGRICCDSNGRLNAQSVLMEGSVETSSGKQASVHLANVQEFSLFPGQVVAMDGTNTSGRKFVASKVYEVGCTSSRLNAQSVLMEGSVETSLGKQASVHLANVQEFSLFPGQVVAMDGTNTSGRKFVASKVYEGVPLPQADLENSLLDYGALQVLTAAGPFTTSDNVNFDPLNDLLAIVKQEKPDVCILFGPFVDAKHAHIAELDTSYEELYSQMIHDIMEATDSLGTQIVLVPSGRDIHHCCIYPQPPLSKPKDTEAERLHTVSDPCTLSINGIVFGLTSTDILFHLGAEEISHPPGGSDRLGRLVKHMLTQQNYYPLYPAHTTVPIDYEQFANYAHMSVTPDVLITPSDLRYFIKDVLGCMSINPGRLAKGQVGGTYGRLVIHPSKTEGGSKGILGRTTAKIVRI